MAEPFMPPSWHECKPCAVQWKGTGHDVCWCCGTPGDAVRGPIIQETTRIEGVS